LIEAGEQRKVIPRIPYGNSPPPVSLDGVGSDRSKVGFGIKSLGSTGPVPRTGGAGATFSNEIFGFAASGGGGACGIVPAKLGGAIVGGLEEAVRQQQPESSAAR